MEHKRPTPIDVRHLFRPLNQKLLELLRSLAPEDWTRPTVARLWSVKDVAAHLLDGNIRALSIQRDRYFGETAPNSTAYSVMVSWLNGLNADWIKASRRISPAVLIWLHEMSSEAVTSYFESQDLYSEAVFPVGWMGEARSINWMHVAREYTEKWHHQQQIREATGRDGIMTRDFYYPLIDTFLRGLPHALRDAYAPAGAVIKVTIRTEAGGDWYLVRSDGDWQFCEKPDTGQYAATVSLDPEIAWRLFSKSVRPHQVGASVEIQGDRELGGKVLQLVAVMA